MERRWYGRDTGLTVRMGLTLFLLAAVYLGFVVLLLWLGVDFIGVAVIAGALLLVQYYASDRMVLWAARAREVTPQEAPDLHAQVERVAASADLPKPRVALIESRVPNAFATGRSPRAAVVAVTTGLLERLEPPEVEAVLAHEVTHIKNRDVMVLTLASFFAMVAAFMLRWFAWGAIFGTRRASTGRREGAAPFLLAYLGALLVWVVAHLLILALSRYREFAADRGGAILIGAPGLLASALMKISGSIARIPDRDLREVRAANAFFIVPAARGADIAELLSTHPSLERRLERLRRLQAQMEGR